MRDSRVLRTIADAIADGNRIDWEGAQASELSTATRLLVDRLKTISSATAPNRLVDMPPPRTRYGVAALTWAIVALAGSKALIAASSVLIFHTTSGGIPWGPVANLLAFGLSGGALWFGRTRDARTGRLGLLFVVISSSFADPLLQSVPALVRPLATVLRSLPADAFLATAFWLFAVSFPAPPLSRPARRLASALLGVVIGLCTLLFVANAIRLFGTGTGHPAFAPLTGALDRQRAEGSFWLISFSLTIAAIPYLLWKSRFDGSDERYRAALFAGSLAAGFTPTLVVVLITPFVPILREPATREQVARFLYASLLLVVPLTVYAVRVHRVVEIRVLISKALQLAVVHATVLAACAAPLVGLTAYLYLNRELTISAVMLSEQTLGLVALPLIAGLALTFRRPLLRAIDRRLLGRSVDVGEVFKRLQHELREADGVVATVATLAREIERAVHSHPVAILVLDRDTGALVSPTHLAEPLPRESVLATLLRIQCHEIHVEADAAGPVQCLLSADDRRWLATHHIQLLVAMTGTSGDMSGVVCVGAKRNALPYSKVDRLVLHVIASHGAVLLENHMLRSTRPPDALHAGSDGLSGIDWSDEPGACCASCLTIWPPRTTSCECGALTTSAAVPLLVGGKFRIQRLLGAGGMAFVYLATDLSLDRQVVVKALPRLTADRRLRLQREARAMAAVSHPNLGMIFSVESWRGAPLLVMELLDGGTLAERLRLRPLAVADVLNLGIALADALDRLHGAGILHRDIKPSNIGYTADGVPKLFDFGVALARHDAHRMEGVPLDPVSWVSWRPRAGTSPPESALRTTPDRLLGTPLYLSPELLAGDEPSSSLDLWSLGLVLFEAVAGTNPFQASSLDETVANISRATIPDIRRLRPDCPLELQLLFGQLLARQPSERPASAAELRHRLRRIQSDFSPVDSDPRR